MVTHTQAPITSITCACQLCQALGFIWHHFLRPRRCHNGCVFTASLWVTLLHTLTKKNNFRYAKWCQLLLPEVHKFFIMFICLFSREKKKCRLESKQQTTTWYKTNLPLLSGLRRNGPAFELQAGGRCVDPTHTRCSQRLPSPTGSVKKRRPECWQAT